MLCSFEFGWKRYDRNKPKCSIFEPAPMNSGWTETLGTDRVGWEINWNFDRIFFKKQGVHKKWYVILSSDEGDMIETSPSAPYSNLLLWTLAELKLWGPVESVEKKIEILIEYSLKNKVSLKKMVHDSEFRWGRYDRNKPKCFVFKPAPMNSNWTEVLGRPHFLSLAWYEQLGNWPWRHPKWTTHSHYIGP